MLLLSSKKEATLIHPPSLCRCTVFILLLSRCYVYLISYFLGIFILFIGGGGRGGGVQKSIENTANLIQGITLASSNSVYFGIKNTEKNTLNFHKKCNGSTCILA